MWHTRGYIIHRVIMRLECRADKLGTLPTIRRTLSQTSQAIEKSVPIWSKMHTTIRPQVESLQPYGMIQTFESTGTSRGENYVSEDSGNIRRRGPRTIVFSR